MIKRDHANLAPEPSRFARRLTAAVGPTKAALVMGGRIGGMSIDDIEAQALKLDSAGAGAVGREALWRASRPCLERGD